MLIEAKFARPEAARGYIHAHALAAVLDRRLVLIQAPAGTLLTESLVAILEGEDQQLIWLRFGPEDFDPGVCMLSLLTALHSLNPAAGTEILHQMQHPPGPVQGWPRLYRLLAQEMCAALSSPVRIVLVNLHYLNRCSQTPLLLGRSFLDNLPESFQVMLTTQAQTPAAITQRTPAIVNAPDLLASPAIFHRLCGDFGLSLDKENLRRALRLTGGSLEALVGLCRAGRVFGSKYLYSLLERARNRAGLLNPIIHDWLETLDEPDLHAAAILSYLGYNHPDINLAVTGRQTLTPAPWTQALSRGWVRPYPQWRQVLRSPFSSHQAYHKKALRAAAGYLCGNKAALQGIRLLFDLPAYDLAAHFLEQKTPQMMNLGQWEQLSRWLARLPREEIMERGSLLYARGEIKTAQGNLAAARQAFHHAGLQFLSAEEPSSACMSFLAISTLANRQGDDNQAWTSALQARRIARGASLSLQEAWAEYQLGCLSIRDRDAHLAAHYFNQAVESLAQNPQAHIQPYFNHLHTLALARQQKQDERRQHHHRYLETLQEERAQHDRLQDHLHPPEGETGDLIAAVQWSHLPLMLKVDGMPQDQAPQSFKRKPFSRPKPLGWIGNLGPGRLISALKKMFNGAASPSQEHPLPEAAGPRWPLAQLPVSNPGPGEQVSNPAPEGPAGRPEHNLAADQPTKLTHLKGDQGSRKGTVAAYLLGPFRLSIDDLLLEHLPTGNSGVLLRYFIHRRKRSVPREELMELLWPGVNPETARNRLNVAMSTMRKELRRVTDLEIVLFESDRYFLNQSNSLWVDVDAFEGTLAEAAQLEAAGDSPQAIRMLEVAANLYKGDYLQEDPYEEWTLLTRERLRLANLDALNRLSRFYFQQQQYAACAALCQAILERDNCREDVHCLLMRCYSRQGLFHLGLRQYQSCQEALQAGLDIQPAPTTLAIYERMRRREITEPLPPLKIPSQKN